MSFFSTKGRLTRTEFLLQKFILFLLFITIILTMSLLTNGNKDSSASALGSLLILFGFGFYVVCDIIITTKRFHDLNKSGTSYLLLLIPIYNIILSLKLLFERGTSGTNNYGEDPRFFENRRLKTRNKIAVLCLVLFINWQLFETQKRQELKLTNEIISKPSSGDFIVYEVEGENEYIFSVAKVSLVSEDNVTLYIGNYFYKSTYDAERSINSPDFNMNDYFGNAVELPKYLYKDLEIISVIRR